MKKFLIPALLLGMTMTHVMAQDLPVVTVKPDLEPQFSVEVSQSDMNQIARGLEGLNRLPSVTISINDLFAVEDAATIRRASNLISSKFIETAKDLIDLRAMIYKLSALSQIYSAGSSDYESLVDSYRPKMQSIFVKMIGRLMVTEDSMIDVINKCKSEACIKFLINAQREMINFGIAINKTIKITDKEPIQVNWKFKHPLALVVIDQTSNAIMPTSENSYANLVRNTVSILAGENAVSLITTNKDWVLPDIKLKKMPKRIGKNSLKETDLVLKRALYRIINGTTLVEIKYVGADLITCTVDEFGGFHIVAWGKSIYDECYSHKLGKRVDVKASGLGLGASATMGGGAVFMISGLIPKKDKVRFVGIEAAGGFAIGAQAGVYLGGHGAIMVTATGMMGVGTHVRFNRVLIEHYKNYK